MSLFKGQSQLRIELDCETPVEAASVKQILFKKPSGITGEYNATASGNWLWYEVLDTDIDQAGDWQFQSYVVIGGKKAKGSIVKINFKEPLK